MKDTPKKLGSCHVLFRGNILLWPISDHLQRQADLAHHRPGDDHPLCLAGSLRRDRHDPRPPEQGHLAAIFCGPGGTGHRDLSALAQYLSSQTCARALGPREAVKREG